MIALIITALQLSNLPEGLNVGFIFKRALKGLSVESEL